MTKEDQDDDLSPPAKTARNSKKLPVKASASPVKRKIKRIAESKSVVLLTSSQQVALKKLLKQVA